MKKIYILLVTIMVTSLSFGQELLTNGDLEQWDDTTTPTGWTAYGHDQETADVHGGTYAAKRDGTTNSGTKKLIQTLTVTGGDNYTVSFWYNVVSERTSGDATHSARIYATWKDASDAATADQTTELRAYPSGYTVGTWTEYTATFNAPADAATLSFSVRAYGDSTIIWDDLSFMHNAVAQPGLSITSPSNGDVFAVGNDVSISFVATNFDIGATDGTHDGHIHLVLDGDTANTIMKYDTTPFVLSGLAAGTHSAVLTLVDDTHAPITPAVNATVSFEVTNVMSVANLAALRADVITNGVGGLYELQSTPTVTYARTSRNQKYIQDGSAAILIDDQPGVITTIFAEGDGMSGLVGQTSYHYGVLQFNPSADATVVAGAVITPEVVTVGDIAANQEMYESELVKIQGVTFADAGTAFVANHNYDFSDAATMTFRSSFSEADYVVNGDLVPTGAVDITVFVGEYNGTPQVVARSLADMTVAAVAENTIKGFNMYPNPVNGTILNITTLQNLDKNVQIFDILGKQVLATTITGNTVNVSKLNAGIYLIKVQEAGDTVTRKLVIK